MFNTEFLLGEAGALACAQTCPISFARRLRALVHRLAVVSVISVGF